MKSGVNQVPNIDKSKSISKSVLLTFFFGPFGMFYSTLSGAIIMLNLYIIIGIVTSGVGLLFIHPISTIWGIIAVISFNNKLLLVEKQL